jgi:hypothetical protein
VNQTCNACGGEIVSTTHDDGARTWRCPCGRTEGCMLPRGALDLGIIRADSPGENNLAAFYETFEQVTQVDPQVDP